MEGGEWKEWRARRKTYFVAELDGVHVHEVEEADELRCVSVRMDEEEGEGDVRARGQTSRMPLCWMVVRWIEDVDGV